jgi:hypothetical protein
MKAFFLIFACLLIVAPVHAQIRVGGDAGSEVDVWYDGACYWARNRSPRKVKVQLGSAYATVLNPGQSFKFTYFGACFSFVNGATEAFYVPEPPNPTARPAPPSQTGSLPPGPPYRVCRLTEGGSEEPPGSAGLARDIGDSKFRFFYYPKGPSREEAVVQCVHFLQETGQFAPTDVRLGCSAVYGTNAVNPGQLWDFAPHRFTVRPFDPEIANTWPGQLLPSHSDCWGVAGPPQPAPPATPAPVKPNAALPSPVPPPAETEEREVWVKSCLINMSVYIVWLGVDGSLRGPQRVWVNSKWPEGTLIIESGSGGNLARTRYRMAWVYAETEQGTIIGGDVSPKSSDRIFKFSAAAQKEDHLPPSARFSAVQLSDAQWLYPHNKPYGHKTWRADLTRQ